MNPPTITFITLASNAYWLGFAALVESIRANSGLELKQYKFMAYSTAPIPEWVESWAKKREEVIEFHVGEELDDFVELSTQKLERLSVSIKKLGLFGIPHQGTDRHVFVDSDMLCLGPLTDIFQFEPFAGVPNSQTFLESIDGSDSTDHINGGFFAFEPSKQDRDELFALYRENPEKFTQFGDQDVFAEWVRRGKQVNFMPSEWNCIKGLLRKPKFGMHWKYYRKVRLLHFTSAKPWDALKGIKLSEGRYLFPEMAWWKHYNLSGITPPRKVLPRYSRHYPLQRWGVARFNYLVNRFKRLIGKLNSVKI